MCRVCGVHDENWFHIILFSYLNEHSNENIDIVDIPQHNIICRYYIQMMTNAFEMKGARNDEV